MIHRCDSCPGKEKLVEYLHDTFSQFDFELDQLIDFKQWSSVGQCKLLDCCETLSDFIELLSESADITTTHHYTTKSQASYL